MEDNCGIKRRDSWIFDGRRSLLVILVKRRGS